MSEQQQIDPQTRITLLVNFGIVNALLSALGKQPYEQVAPLVDIIRQQAIAQLPKPETATEETTGEQA